MRCNVSWIAVLVLLVTVVTAQAGTILSPVEVIANSGGQRDGSTAIENTINQSGLYTGFTSGVTDFDTYMAGNPIHAMIYTNEWFAPSAVMSSVIDYDLGAQYLVPRLAMWNEDAWGIAEVFVYTSNDPTFASSTFVGSFFPTDGAHSVDYPADVVALTPTFARYVRLDVTAPQGVDAVSMGEIAFDVGAVPEPSTLAIFGLGLIGVVALRRRRING